MLFPLPCPRDIFSFCFADFAFSHNTPEDLGGRNHGFICKKSNHTKENGTLGRSFFPRGEVPHSRDHPAAHELVVDRGSFHRPGVPVGFYGLPRH
jgi:hypothetical protein